MQVRALARACIFFFIRNIIMILGSKGHTFHARMKKYDFGTRKT